MNHFQRRKGQLCCEEVPLSELAEEVGTPAYVYSTATLLRHARVFRAALRGLDVLPCFAVKSAPNLALLVLLAAGTAGIGTASMQLSAQTRGSDKAVAGSNHSATDHCSSNALACRRSSVASPSVNPS